MMSASECFRRAAQCEWQARSARDQNNRSALLAAAQSWAFLGQSAQPRDERQDSAFECLRRADRCEWRARSVRDQFNRNALLAAAQSWSYLGQSAEPRDEREDPEKSKSGARAASLAHDLTP